MTRLLLDTHLLLWWLAGDPRLSAKTVERIRADDTEVFISHASLWELAIKVSLGRVQVDLIELERQVPASGFQWLPIQARHLQAVAHLESDGPHRDPLNRLLVCQSRVEPMLLLTVDRQLLHDGSTVVGV